MTYQEFLTELRKTPRDWRKGERGQLRRCGQCPITSLLDDFAYNWSSVASEIALPSDITINIINAADNGSGCDRDIRWDLLSACGL